MRNTATNTRLVTLICSHAEGEVFFWSGLSGSATHFIGCVVERVRVHFVLWWIHRSPHSRMRERVRGWERGTHVALERISSANNADLPPLGPLHLLCDMFTTKGQRVTSSYFFASLHRSMCRLIKSSPLAKRITVLIENGFRSSRQAAGLLSYLANLDRCNHRNRHTSGMAWRPCGIIQVVLLSSHPQDRQVGSTSCAVHVCHWHVRTAQHAPIQQLLPSHGFTGEKCGDVLLFVSVLTNALCSRNDSACEYHLTCVKFSLLFPFSPMKFL